MRLRSRSGWAILVALLAALAVAAAGCGQSNGPVEYSPPPQIITATPALTPTPGPTLNCTSHASAGQEDDSVQIVLACAVSRAPTGDTSYTLHFGVTDPAGQFHALTPTCAGSLHNGAGSCNQTYQFIFPFSANPGPVTGVFAPSGLRFGPVIPVSA